MRSDFTARAFFIAMKGSSPKMKPRRIFSTLLLSLGLILLTFAATCRLVMTNIQIDYDPSSPATVTLTVFGQSDEYALVIDAD